ncbi:MAG: hypothetical protein KC503_35465 [Myxococcales bacterium]|nr:hypothetical protein [Myxococcales bacterium]
MLDRRVFARASLPLLILSVVVIAVAIWQRWYIAAWVSGMALSGCAYALWAKKRAALDKPIWDELAAIWTAAEAGGDGVYDEIIARLEALVPRAKSPNTRAVLEHIAWRALGAARVDDAVDAVSRMPPSTGASALLHAALYVKRGHVREGKRLLERALPGINNPDKLRIARALLKEAEAALATAPE